MFWQKWTYPVGETLGFSLEARVEVNARTETVTDGVFSENLQVQLPMGFKAMIFEENERASMHIEVNPLADFIAKYMVDVSTLTEEDAWTFLLACFEWVGDYGYEFEAEKTIKGYKLSVAKKA